MLIPRCALYNFRVVLYHHQCTMGITNRFHSVDLLQTRSHMLVLGCRALHNETKVHFCIWELRYTQSWTHHGLLYKCNR